MLVHVAGRNLPVILTRMPVLDAMPDDDALDARIDAILNAEWLTEEERYALKEAGMAWYTETVPNVILELAIHHDTTPRVIAGMLAAISSGYSWGLSLDHVSTLLEDRSPGQRASKDDPVPGVAAPYGWRSIAQAEAIRDGADPDEILRSADGRTDTVKRWNFFHALMEDGSKVTVDVHMARGLTGGFIDATPSSARVYRHLADAIRRAADRHDMPPADMQAVLWTLIRGEAH